jgi:formylglycine-generating enzyme required for sulfatase activity
LHCVLLPRIWWQQAGTAGNRKNTYPWGPDWDDGRANVLESGLGRTTAVGMYPAGAWEGGPADLAGNVWEWCLNKYEKPNVTQPDVSENYRVVRGGSWSFAPDNAQASNRNLNLPHHRGDNCGSRVCCASPIV